jgi:hypothetical protein
MARTTVDIAAPILDELKAVQEQEGKSFGGLVSELLAEALARRRSKRRRPAVFHWFARPMQARVDLDDKEAVYALLDKEDKR